MDEFTADYLNKALFEEGEFEITSSEKYNDIVLGWEDPENLTKERIYEPNERWHWDGGINAEGITWGGCLESIDEMLRHGITIPSLEDFENVVLLAETSEEIPPHDYVFRIYRALGERGILERVRAILIGRPQAWDFETPNTPDQKQKYRERQRETTLKGIRTYNKSAPIIQNLDFGHTNPQIPFPYGRRVRINSTTRKITAEF